MTFCVAQRKPVLANARAWRICRATFDKLDQWTILAAIAMPDHLRLLASPVADRDAPVTAFAKWFKRWFNEAYWNCRPSVSGGRDRTWNCSDQTSPFPKNGNMCGKTRCAQALLRILMIGRFNFNSTQNCRPSLRDGDPRGRRLTQTPYKRSARSNRIKDLATVVGSRL